MGVVHGGIIMDTLPRVLDHSSLPLTIHLGGTGSFPLNVGWNVEWNRDRFYSGVLAWYTLPMFALSSSNSLCHFKRICYIFL
jgi:hypothetical protein